MGPLQFSLASILTCLLSLRSTTEFDLDVEGDRFTELNLEIQTLVSSIFGISEKWRTSDYDLLWISGGLGTCKTMLAVYLIGLVTLPNTRVLCLPLFSLLD
jgi:hypothetical protein